MFRNALIATLVLVGAGVAVPGAAYSDTKDKKIALSNSTDGDPWRQAMLKSWERVSAQAVRDGIVKETAVFPTAEKQVAEQEAQIQSLIHQGYDAIVVNAASRDGLNGVIRQACDAGIVVVSFDGIVSEPCAWRLSVDFKAMGKAQLAYLKEVMPDGGNLLEIRGLAGTPVDDAIHAGVEEALAEIALPFEERASPFCERDVIEPVGVFERLLRDAAEQTTQHCFVDRLLLRIEQRVRVALATDDAKALPLVLERAADAKLGRLVHVRIGRRAIDPVKQPRDRAQRRALAGLVATEHDMQSRRRKIE